MEPFTFQQLEKAWRTSSQSYYLMRHLQPTDAMGKVVASYNSTIDLAAAEGAESLAACAVGCVLGYRTLLQDYSRKAATKPLLFTGNARCVGWVRDMFDQVTTYVVDAYMDGWHRVLLRPRPQKQHPIRYDVRYWKPAQPRPEQLPVMCKGDVEGLTGVNTSLTAPDVWQQQPDIHMGALNVFLGARYMVRQALRNHNTKPLWDMIMDYGFNARHEPTLIRLTHDEWVTFYAASLQPFHERTPGSQCSNLLFREILNPREGGLRFSLTTEQALAL